MNNSESGMAKKNIVVRFLAFSLAAIMMLGAFAVVPVLSVESEPEAEQSQSAQNNSEIVYDEDVLSITVDGEERTELEIYENEKVTIKAEGVLAAKYQWQILHPERSGLWVDIYEETKATLDVSLALTSNMEQEDGKTYLRCLAYEAEGAYVTDVLSVSTLEGSKPIDAPEIPKLETGKVDYNLVQEDGDDHPEFVTVTIKYEKYEYQYSMEDDEYVLTHMGTAFSSYQATIQYGADFSTSVNSPTIVGFDPYYKDPVTNQETVTKAMNIALTNVQEDVIYTVNYKPAEVDYEVHYYFQNIYDDLYVEDESKAKDATGKTGLRPEEGIDTEFEGFTALYYHPDVIAADGSTVFEVYYERNYYLMEFDCDGGYGVHTIYVRHGTYVSIATPTKPGYIFNGWDLEKTEDLNNPPSTTSPIYDDENNIIGYNTEDGTADTLPSEMPKYNTAYKALWKTYKTTYTVIYWRENAEDDGYSYWGSIQMGLGTDDKPDGSVMSNDKVSGADHSVAPSSLDDYEHFEYNSAKTILEETKRTDLVDGKVIVEGDGSTVVNVYYYRKTYTITFVAKGICTLDEHTHDDCSIICSLTEHEHTCDECCDANNHLHWWDSANTNKCPYGYEHTHGFSCYDCGKIAHTHTNACNNSNSNSVVKVVSRKYDSSIIDIWPVVDDNGMMYPIGTSWRSSVTQKQYSFLEKIPDQDITMTWHTGTSGNKYTWHYYLEVLPGEDLTDVDTKEDGGKTYKWYFTSSAYSNGSLSLTYAEDYFPITGYTQRDDDVPNFSSRTAYLYYLINKHTLTLYNVNTSVHTINDVYYNQLLKDLTVTETVDGVSKTVSLSEYVPPYPSTYEPGAYEFGGWYITPECFDGTEVNWDTDTMPDSDFEIYAKWTPIVRNVVFYKFYSDVSKGLDYAWHADPEKPTKYPITVPHGELLGTTYSHIPYINDDYKFIGWFYFDENGKKKFAPDSMKVTRDLDLFAEWYTTIPTTYEVKYEAWDEKTEEKIEEIAVKTEGYSTAGKTVTFMAKGSSALYDKKPPVSSSTTYRTNWFPTPSSHSILMQEDSALNTFTFKYYYKEYINYKIRYVDRSTGKILEESKVLQTSKAVETIKFKPFEGYLPEDYYIEKAIMYDPTDYNTYPDHVMEENIIYFYYNPDTEHAPFRIEHYQQDLDGENYTLAYTEQGISDLNQPKDAASREFKGYTYKPAKSVVITYKKVGDEWVENEPVSGTSGTVTLGGLIIRLYYDRNVVNYTINYIDAGSNTVMYTDSSKSGIFGSTVSEVAPGLHIYNGDTYYYIAGKDAEEIERTKSITIREKAEDNVIDFYYSIKTITIHYHKVCSVPDLDDLNGVSVANQKISKLDDSVNSTAMPGKGFQFKGWFYDEACTQPVPEANVVDNTIYPGVPNSIVVEDADGTEHFYALFEPVYGSLKLTKSAGTTENNESFLFHIKGKAGTVTGHIDMIVTITNAGSKIIEKLPIGEYTVSEMESWSYTFIVPRNEDGTLRFELVQSATVKENDTVEVLFERAIEDSDWLTGEKIDQDE